MRTYKIVETATGKVEHTIETDATGSSLDRFEDGLYPKVDFERFHIEGPEDES